MADKIYYYIMDKHGVIYGRSVDEQRLQNKMESNFSEKIRDELGLTIKEMFDGV